MEWSFHNHDNIQHNYQQPHFSYEYLVLRLFQQSFSRRNVSIALCDADPRSPIRKEYQRENIPHSASSE